METTAYSRGQLRVSDADRDGAIAELSDHFQAGRLTQDEFEERSGQALRARTSQELAVLFTDLPRPQAPAAHPAIAGGRVSPAPYRAPIPRIALAVCLLVVATSILGGHRGHHGHHELLALAPMAIFLVVALVARHRPWDHRDR